ncbi:hypothetical protein N6L27_00945 [Leisingera sp. SS27]|uniref:hypothetical protein n=1 Tax=Leisingera sp. SS27 TaxID=2979462 RepID=UPI00232E5CED|nr:hypothetical protein [Leisingera sp. SS27]MDC0656561.1 hypothetical protein [Leisingera sp. SS27]
MDAGMIMGCKFTAKPGTLFTIRKETCNRVEAAFAENGISFARREVRMAIPGPEDADRLNDTGRPAAAAAAQHQAAEENKKTSSG